MDTNSTNTTAKTVISVFLSFTLCLCLFLVIMAVIFKSTIFNVRFIETNIAKSSYTKNLSTDIREALCNYGDIGGKIPSSIFNESVKDTTVAKEVLNYFQASMKNQSYTIQTDALTKELSAKLTAYAKTQDTSLVTQKDLTSNINTLAESCAASYKSAIGIKIIPMFGKIAYQFNRFFPIIELFLVICLLLVSLFLYFLNRRRRQVFHYFIFACSGVCLMLLTVPLFMTIFNIVPRVGISSKTLYLFITGTLNSFFSSFYFFAALFALLTGILVSGYLQERKKLRKS